MACIMLTSRPCRQYISIKLNYEHILLCVYVCVCVDFFSFSKKKKNEKKEFLLKLLWLNRHSVLYAYGLIDTRKEASLPDCLQTRLEIILSMMMMMALYSYWLVFKPLAHLNKPFLILFMSWEHSKLSLPQTIWTTNVTENSPKKQQKKKQKIKKPAA